MYFDFKIDTRPQRQRKEKGEVDKNQVTTKAESSTVLKHQGPS